MKHHTLLLIIPALLLAARPAPAQTTTQPADGPVTENDKISYSVGLRIGADLKMLNNLIDPDMLFQGLKDALAGNEPRLTEEEVAEAQNNFAQMIQDIRTRRISEMAQNNAQQGQQFLVENRNKDGVTTTDSGLQYEVLEQGDGDKPTGTDSVTVHYRGTLIDGTEFDSSHSRGQPATFPVNGVIAGWTEALQLMPVGSKYRLVIPPNLAYGERGAGPQIGPNSTLIFEVELLSIGN